MAQYSCHRQSNSKFSQWLGCSLVLLLVLNGTAAAAASHAQAAADGQGSSTKRRLLQEALLPELVSNNQSLINNSAALTCLGWNSTQCLTSSIDKPAFALVGDSITHLGFKSDGWATLLEAAYGGAVNAVNYGIPGANSSQGDVLLDKLLQQFGAQLQQVKLVTICFGANDAVKPHITNKHLPVPEFKANLRHLVSRLQEKGIKRIVLVTPPPVGQRNDRDNTITANYTAAVTELAKEMKLESVDVYSAIMAVDQWQDKALATDQLHLASVGQKVFFDSVLQLLDKSSDLSTAVLGAQQQPQQPSAETKQAVVVLEEAAQQQQQTQPQPQQQTKQQHGPDASSPGLPVEEGKAMSNVLCILLVLAFLALVTEAKRVSQSSVGGDGTGRKVAP